MKVRYVFLIAALIQGCAVNPPASKYMAIAPTGVDVKAALTATERKNLSTFGYGVKSFAISMVEAAITISGGTVPTATLELVQARMPLTRERRRGQRERGQAEREEPHERSAARTDASQA